MCKTPVSKGNFREKGDRILKTEYVLPNEIEKRSFEIIESELNVQIPEEIKPIVLRVIHTTADFDFADNLKFSENAVPQALAAIKNGVTIVTDTNMARAGINRAALEKLGCRAVCFMADEDVAKTASQRGITRAAASVEKAAHLGEPVIYAVGNAPTALAAICEFAARGEFSPALVIGAPVGFVNVIQSKELLVNTRLPYIAAMGRKGGSTVAAAIVNALLYMAVNSAQ